MLGDLLTVDGGDSDELLTVRIETTNDASIALLPPSSAVSSSPSFASYSQSNSEFAWFRAQVSIIEAHDFKFEVCPSCTDQLYSLEVVVTPSTMVPSILTFFVDGLEVTDAFRDLSTSQNTAYEWRFTFSPFHTTSSRTQTFIGNFVSAACSSAAVVSAPYLLFPANSQSANPSRICESNASSTADRAYDLTVGFPAWAGTAPIFPFFVDLVFTSSCFPATTRTVNLTADATHPDCYLRTIQADTNAGVMSCSTQELPQHQVAVSYYASRTNCFVHADLNANGLADAGEPASAAGFLLAQQGSLVVSAPSSAQWSCYDSDVGDPAAVYSLSFVSPLPATTTLSALSSLAAAAELNMGNIVMSRSDAAAIACSTIPCVSCVGSQLPCSPAGCAQACTGEDLFSTDAFANYVAQPQESAWLSMMTQQMCVEKVVASARSVFRCASSELCGACTECSTVGSISAFEVDSISFSLLWYFAEGRRGYATPLNLSSSVDIESLYTGLSLAWSQPGIDWALSRDAAAASCAGFAAALMGR
jgi:hypothetical protein